MMFAFDYDGTWSNDPALFAHFAHAADLRGHRSIIVTNRSPSEPINVPEMVVVYASGRPKREAAKAAGFTVDVWVDDMPTLVDWGAEGLVMLAALTP